MLNTSTPTLQSDQARKKTTAAVASWRGSRSVRSAARLVSVRCCHRFRSSISVSSRSATRSSHAIALSGLRPWRLSTSVAFTDSKSAADRAPVRRTCFTKPWKTARAAAPAASASSVTRHDTAKASAM